jgi:NDP-sugar pyrophosphorylase family protein
MPPFAILAGGLGTRLGPLTQALPKAMVPVAGEPFIAHQLRLLRREGVESIIICAGHLAGPLIDFVGDGQRFGLDVTISLDGPGLLGSGGALRKALPSLGDEFAFLYGDSYLDTAYWPIVDAFRRSGQPGLMTVFRNSNRWGKSNVIFEDGFVLKYDKQGGAEMSYIDYGLNFLRSSVLAAWPEEGPFDISSVLTDLAAQKRLAGYEVRTRFYEIGSLTGLAETEAYLRRSASS